jgi:predicted transcriptional regulator
MSRILADLPDEDIKWLDHLAAVQGKSRAAVLREAVEGFKAQAQASVGKAWLDIGFGAWRDCADIEDTVAWQRRERASWTRPWNDNYEAVKAEFPELFDDEDDRQRQIHLAMLTGRYPEPKKPPLL